MTIDHILSWYADNHDRIIEQRRAYQREWRRAHKERVREYRQRPYEKNYDAARQLRRRKNKSIEGGD